tara:strand:- start:60197 stop:60409 length:213 start_codon:yes stop_codon:yes gene_type:complete
MVTSREMASLSEVCERIAERSTFSRADVVGVVQSLIDLLPELLLDGKNDRLDSVSSAFMPRDRGKTDQKK